MCIINGPKKEQKRTHEYIIQYITRAVPWRNLIPDLIVIWIDKI
jgi:hypothetical protein